MSLWDDFNKAKALFKTNQEALDYFIKEFEAKGGMELWEEAENSGQWTEEYAEIMRLKRCVDVCRYLVKKEKGG